MRSRRLQAWLCVLLLLLQAVAPALHALQHHGGPAAGRFQGSGLACACGRVHGGTADRPERVASAEQVARDHAHCAVCEILRGIRLFDGPSDAAEPNATPAHPAVAEPAPASPRCADRPRPFLARAPPQLLV
jgi:hypothetical protein